MTDYEMYEYLIKTYGEENEITKQFYDAMEHGNERVIWGIRHQYHRSETFERLVARSNK